MKYTRDIFIGKANIKHKKEYDYSKTEYINSKTKVCIICPKHGEFWQKPNSHLHGNGCPICAGQKIKNKKLKSRNQYIEDAKKVHGDKYDYSKVEYKNNIEKICIICPEHGEFWQNPNSHLQGNGCPVCGKEKMSRTKTLTTKQFIEKARQVHSDKYDYSKVDYTHSLKKICIICPEHGEFWQKPFSHLEGSGCPKCADNQPITKEEFIKRSIEKHGNKYDYSKSEYKNNRIKTEIICHKKDENGIEHGSFFTTPHSHLNGSGCPKCKQNYRLENEVRLLLIKNEIEFEEKKTFDGLKYKIALRPDFYLPKENIIIECQGIQHFKPVNFGGVDEKKLKGEYELNLLRDSIKRKYCEEHNIKLLEYTHCNIKNKDLIKTKEKLLKEIKKNDKRRNKKA